MTRIRERKKIILTFKEARLSKKSTLWHPRHCNEKNNILYCMHEALPDDIGIDGKFSQSLSKSVLEINMINQEKIERLSDTQ